MVVAVAKIWGMANADRIDADPVENEVRHGGRAGSRRIARLGRADPWDRVRRPCSTMAAHLPRIGKSREEAPKSPMLYIKPANTWIGYGATIPLGAGVGASK